MRAQKHKNREQMRREEERWRAGEKLGKVKGRGEKKEKNRSGEQRFRCRELNKGTRKRGVDEGREGKKMWSRGKFG